MMTAGERQRNRLDQKHLSRFTNDETQKTKTRRRKTKDQTPKTTTK